MTDYRELFSSHAALYARARPHYPPALFAHLAGLCPARGLAWDVATGNGQAAVGLAAHFDRIVATDASAEQIRHAAAHPRIAYHVAAAEDPALIEYGTLTLASVDLVTIAQALHWLEHDAFYDNVRRAARPGGVIAAWCYTPPRVNERVDAVLDRFYHDVVGPYWEPNRRYIDERFETIPFPFAEPSPSRASHGPVTADPSRDSYCPVATDPSRDRESASSQFACRSEWTLPEYLAYIESWSAVQKYRRERGSDPVELICADLSRAWGGATVRRTALSPIYLRTGRV